MVEKWPLAGFRVAQFVWVLCLSNSEAAQAHMGELPFFQCVNPNVSVVQGSESGGLC